MDVMTGSSMSVCAFRAEIDSPGLYLDHAGVSPLPRFARRAIEGLLERHSQWGKQGVKHGAANTISSVRAHLAQLIGAHNEEISLTENTTKGLNIIASGYPWRSGDNILVPMGEFPANVYPWLALQARGVEIRRVPDRNGVISEAELAPYVDRHTRMLALSHVGYHTGFRADLHAIGAFCKAHDIHFVVDGAQSVGVHRVDVGGAQIDALSSCGWKWLMGPLGSGFLYCSQDFAQLIEPVFVGAGAMVASESDPACWPFALHNDGRRFEYSSLNHPAFWGLLPSLSRLLEIGLDTIETRVLERSNHLRCGLKSLGYEVLGDWSSNHHSGIVSFRKEGVCSQQLAEQLNASVGGWHGYVRLSPHFYNTEQEICDLLSQL